LPWNRAGRIMGSLIPPSGRFSMTNLFSRRSVLGAGGAMVGAAALGSLGLSQAAVASTTRAHW